MDNKYFTPDIEDIRVGYECEIDGKSKVIGEYLIDLQSAKKCLNMGKLRVPYLTKEQIEADGWKFERDHVVELEFSKGEYELTLTENYYLRIAWFGEGDITRFSGECKDINTFRYICKLLHI